MDEEIADPTPGQVMRADVKNMPLNGAGIGTTALTTDCLPSIRTPPGNVNNNIGFRGIPFTDGVRDYGCGKHYQINSIPGIPVAHRAEYGKGWGSSRRQTPNPPSHHR